MPIQDIDYSPGADTFGEEADKINNNNTYFPTALSATFTTLTLTRNGAPALTTTLAIAPDRIITGIQPLVVNPTTISYSAGTYQINNNPTYAVSAGSVPITSPHPTLDRLDIFTVNTANTAVLIAGTPAVTPATPVLPTNHLLVSVISVPSVASGNPPTVQPDDCACIPEGTINGHTIRWDTGTMAYVTNDSLVATDASTQVYGTTEIRLEVSNTYSSILQIGDGVVNMSVTQGAKSAQWFVGAFSPTEFGQELSSTGELRLTFEQGIKLYPYASPPTSTAYKIYPIGTDLYWNGFKICTEPCDSGTGAVVPDGTVDFSTLRWNDGTSEYVENIYTRNNDGTWSTLMYGDAIVSPSVGNTMILYASIFKGSGTVSLDSNASVIMASGTDNATPIFIIHSAPTMGNPFKGYNGLLGAYRCGITLDSQIGGCWVIASNQGSINKSTSDLGEGFSLVAASKNSSISQSIDYNALIGVQQCQITYGSRCVMTASTSSIFTSSATNTSINCHITACLSSEIRTYSSGVGVKQSERAFLSSSQNSVMRGVTSSGMMATQSCTIKSHGASVSTYSQLLNLTTMVSCFNCTIQQSSTLHFSSLYAVNMLACDSCTVDTQDSNLNATAFVGCKTVSLTQSGSSAGLDGSAFIGCSNLTITLTNAQSNVVVLGLKASYGLTDLRSNTVYAPTVEIFENTLYRGVNMVSGSGVIPNLVRRITQQSPNETLTLQTALDGEYHMIISDFDGSSGEKTTVQYNGTQTIDGYTSIDVPGKTVGGFSGVLVIQFEQQADSGTGKWFVVSKNF